MTDDEETPQGSSELIPDDPVLGQLTRSAIGFLKETRREDGKRMFVPSGSGVFVAVGGTFGILTAAHVILELKKNDAGIALMTITKKRVKAPAIEFHVREAEYVVIGGDRQSETGPDIGFVRLPVHIEERLRAECVAYNFDMRLKMSKSEGQSDPLTREVIVGMMAERSRFKRATDTHRTDEHAISHAYCSSADIREGSGGFDIFDLTVHHNQDVPAPDRSYGGLSGSPVWRVADTPGAGNRFVFGIAFYERRGEDGRLSVICHGPRGIYRDLISAIAQKFPDFQTQA